MSCRRAGRLLPTFGNVALKDITSEVIQSYVGYLTTDCKLSAKYARNIISTMSVMWRQALNWKYITCDPFEGVVLPQVGRPKGRVYTEEETTAIFQAAEGPLKTFIWIAAECGLRPGEVCGLEWQHVDLTNRVISVVQKAWRGHIERPKTEAGYRHFAISAQLAEHLRVNAKGEGLLFAYSNGRPWREEKVREKKLNPLLDSLGIERKGLHSLRHFNATMMDHHNIPVKTRQMRLGHADPRMTLGLRNRSGYTHCVGEDDRRAADMFGSILCPNVSKTETASTPSGAEAAA
jgi:integrase